MKTLISFVRKSFLNKRFPGLPLEIGFELQDIWVGVYWKKEAVFKAGWRINLYICAIPTIVIHVWFGRMGKY